MIFEWIGQGVVAGKSSGNEEKCLEDQLGDAKVAVGRVESEVEQLKTKIKHSEKELKENKTKLSLKHNEAVEAEKQLKIRQKDLENVEMGLKSLSYEEGQMESLEKVCFYFKKCTFAYWVLSYVKY